MWTWPNGGLHHCPKSFKSSLINPKPYKNNLHHHLPSTSFTRRLRDFPPSSSAIPRAFKRCDFSSRSNPWLKRFDGPIKLPEREENGVHYYQSGGIGMSLLGKVGLFLAANPMFKTALVSWALAESIKLLLNLLVERKLDFWSRRMPSPLAALWTGLTISVACCYSEPGPDPDPEGLLLLCCFCTILFIHRSMDRRCRECDWMPSEVQPINRTFNVVQGHTWSQVIAGALLGLLVAIYFFHGPVPAT